MINRIPPHNLDAEKAVLGCVLIDPSVIPFVLENINYDFFYFPAHQKIFQSIIKLFDSGKPIDILSVTHELKKEGILKIIGGSSYLGEIVSFVPTSANVSYYTGLVKESFLRRGLVELASKIDEKSREENTEINSVIDFVHKEVFKFSIGKNNSSFYDAKTLLELQMERADEYAKNPDALRGISTGFTSLDKMLQGLHKSDLIIVAARPSVGKSAFVFDISRHVAVVEKKTVAIFSLEMPALQVIERMLAQQTGINLWNIRMGRLTDKEFEKYNFGASLLAESKIFIDDTSGINISQIRSKTRKLMIDQGLDLVVIDYLQLMQGTGSTENRAFEIGEISRSLKILARELNIPIIALSQLNRSVENRQDKIPQLSDLRESGSIEQDADIVIFLGRDINSNNSLTDDNINESDYNNEENINFNNALKVDVIIAKHRNGPIGKIRLNFVQHQTKFTEE